MAVREALKWMQDMNYSVFILEGDSQVLTKRIRTKDAYKDVAGLITHDLIDRLDSKPEARASWIAREGNRVADCIAKWARLNKCTTTWLDVPPSWLVDQLQVLVEHKSFVRILILNRPKQLNALSDDMVSQLLELFLAYEEDPSVKLIVLKGNGRAFSAGGDISAVVRSIISEGYKRFSIIYFRRLYTLNYVIATCKKPQVSILNGIVMGGGAGVSIHGRFRVVTENTVFAMPEAALGFFPDVGSSYFLSRLSGFLGEYVGLTVARLDGAEMLACGLATHYVHSKKLPLLEEELCKGKFDDLLNISELLNKFSEQPVIKEKSPFHQLHIIDRCFSCRTVEEIISSLEKEASINDSDWISAALQSLKSTSPTSLKVFLRGIREGRHEWVDQCLVREYRMGCALAKFSADFIEGFRAILIDKDRNPKGE